MFGLGLTTATSATNSAIQKNVFGTGMAMLIISNEIMADVLKIIKFLEKSGLILKDVGGTIRNEAKEQKRVFFGLLLIVLGASLLGNLWTY